MKQHVLLPPLALTIKQPEFKRRMRMRMRMTYYGSTTRLSAQS